MCDIEFHPDLVGTFPPLLRERADALTTAATVSSPDTGPTTAATRSVVDEVGAMTSSLVESLDRCQQGIAASLEAYATADGELAWFVRTRIETLL